MRKFPARLQERIQHRLKPAAATLISGPLSDLPRSRIDLLVENALLRQQLIVLNRQVKRPPLINPDRFRFVLLAHVTRFWKQSLRVFQPETRRAGIGDCFVSIGGGNRKEKQRSYPRLLP